MDRKLHILYIVQYFNHPDEPGGSRPYQFARQWAARGHRVTVLTSNLNHKTLSSTYGVTRGGRLLGDSRSHLQPDSRAALAGASSISCRSRSWHLSARCGSVASISCMPPRPR